MKNSPELAPRGPKRREQLDQLLKGLHHTMNDLMALAQEVADIDRNGNNGNANNGNADAARRKKRKKR